MTATQPAHYDAALDPGYPVLKDYLIQATGLSYYADKDDDLRHRLHRRLGETGRDCTGYLALLNDPQQGESELDRLVEDLTVGETSFFRHSELFDGLRDVVVPDILRRNQAARRLRVWSAGCSIGAEAYSIAILLEHHFSAQLEGWEVSILGTDINRRFLARARAGVYHAWDFRGKGPAWLDDCFVRTGPDDRVILPRYRANVSFQYHNLVRHPFPSLVNNLVAFDLILCRNVLIYFGAAQIQQVIGRFHECLVDEGWLLVGHAEPNVETFRAYQTVNVPGAVLYQKVTRPAKAPPLPPCGVKTVVAPPHVAPPMKPSARRAPRTPLTLKVETEADLSQVDRLADEGSLDLALARCAQLIAATPMQPRLHFHYAMLAEQLGDHAKAEASLRRTLYLKPDHALAHYYHGLIQQKRGEPHRARQSYRNVLSLLDKRGENDVIDGTEGMTAGELREMTRMQQEVVEP